MGDGGAGDRVERAAAARREAHGTRARLDAARSYAEQTAARVQECRDRLTAEERDVDKLEGMSWSRILTSLRGSPATVLEREQAERDAARYAPADAEARGKLAQVHRAGQALHQVEATMNRLSERGRETTAELAELGARREELLLS